MSVNGEVKANPAESCRYYTAGDLFAAHAKLQDPEFIGKYKTLRQ